MPPLHEEDEQQQPLTEQYDDSNDDCESVATGFSYRKSRNSPWARYCCWIFAFFLTSVFSALLGAALAFRSFNLDNECSLYTAQYSPVLRDVTIRYDFKAFNGSFKSENIYRLSGSPEVDEAWENLGVDTRASIIPLSEGPASGLSKGHVQVSEKYGGGFLVNVEGMHHLHCLNLVRKSLYYNYDYYKALGTHAFENPDHIVKLHTSHCLDTIRQVLMCNVDTGVLGQVWYDPENVRAFPDFQTHHKCKNFEAVSKWAVEHQAPPLGTLPKDFLKIPDDSDVLPAWI